MECCRSGKSNIFSQTLISFQLHVLDDHSLSVLDVCWSNDCKQILSGGIDCAVKLWDAESGKILNTFQANGFVQTVTFSHESDIVFSGDTKKFILGYDQRTTKNVLKLENDAMVNTMYCYIM